MKQSYAIPYSHSSLYLPRRVRHILQIPRKTVLSGRVIDDTGVPSLILSTLPFDCWASAFRVTVNTHHAVGTFQEVLGVIRRVDLNIMHMWASAFSAEGDLTLTAIVSPLSDHAVSANAIQENIEALLSERSGELGRDLLSSSRLFQGCGLDRCRVSPMKVLRAMAILEPRRDGALQSVVRNRVCQNFQAQLDDGKLDIRNTLLTSSDKEGSYVSLADVLRIPGRQFSSSMLVTPDTEEWYLRVSLMPNTNFYTVRLPVSVGASSPQGLTGVSEDLVAALVDATEINVYYAQSILRGKVFDNGVFREESELTVSGSRDSVSTASVQDAISGVMRKNLLSMAKKRKETDPLSLFDLDFDRSSVTPMFAPFVFLATNAKADTPDYLDVAIELCRLLKDLHFRPVFLNRANSTLGATMTQEMTRILDCSPILISLHLPEPAMRLADARDGVLYSPSAWTMFEEAYIRAKGGRGMFRLIHENVFSPPFLEGQHPWRFRSPQDLREIFPRLKISLELFRVNPDWHDLVLSCQSAMLGNGLGHEFILRDPEQFFLEEKADIVT